jgi:ceramide glucosyltransferase
LHRRAPAPVAGLPGLTVLKPLKGANPEIARCLESWLAQSYPGPLQILFGVADEADPACAMVRALLAEYPDANARLIICRERLGANGKVSTLRQLEPHILHPHVVISDADVEAPADLCANLAPMLAAPGAGLVNCIYRLANPVTTAMRWEAIAINADFWSQVMQARSLAPLDFALGAVMALPASMLQKIGGFASLADYLADDYELGRSVIRAGGRIDLAGVVVDCREAACGWTEVWTHQLRWARTIRICRPVAYFFSVLGNPTLWPLLWVLAVPSQKSIACFSAALLFRIGSALHQQWRLTQSGGHIVYWWLAPVKDILDFMVWAAAFGRNRVEWRGEPYRVLPDGKLARVEA